MVNYWCVGEEGQDSYPACTAGNRVGTRTLIYNGNQLPYSVSLRLPTETHYLTLLCRAKPFIKLFKAQHTTCPWTKFTLKKKWKLFSAYYKSEDTSIRENKSYDIFSWQSLLRGLKKKKRRQNKDKGSKVCHTACLNGGKWYN